MCDTGESPVRIQTLLPSRLPGGYGREPGPRSISPMWIFGTSAGAVASGSARNAPSSGARRPGCAGSQPSGRGACGPVYRVGDGDRSRRQLSASGGVCASTSISCPGRQHLQEHHSSARSRHPSKLGHQVLVACQVLQRAVDVDPSTEPLRGEYGHRSARSDSRATPCRGYPQSRLGCSLACCDAMAFSQAGTWVTDQCEMPGVAVRW